jgi:hypothetical protein
MTCAECGEKIESLRGCAFEVVGWEEKRDQGGTNHILWPERTGRVMCPSCKTSKKHGVSPSQLTIA